MNTDWKKLAALTLALLLSAGCSAKKPAAEPSAGLPNPLTECTQEAMGAATGLYLNAPVGAENVRYFTLNTEGAPTAQVDFELDGTEYTYCAQCTGELEAYDMSGMYYDDWTEKSDYVSYCDAVVKTNDKAAVVYWLDIVPGVNYTLAADGLSAEKLLWIAAMTFEPTQGEVDGDYNG